MREMGTSVRQHTFQYFFLGAFIFLLLAIQFLFYLYYQNNTRFVKSNTIVAHVREVLMETEKTRASINDLALAFNGFVQTKDSDYLKHYQEDSTALYQHLSKLTASKHSNEHQAKLLEFEQLIKQELSYIQEVLQAEKAKNSAKVQELLGLRIDLLVNEKIRALIPQLQLAESEELEFHKSLKAAHLTTSSQLSYLLNVSIQFTLCGLFAMVWFNFKKRKNTEQKLAQQNEALEVRVQERAMELVKIETRFKALIENGFDGVVLMNEQTYASYVSPAALRLTGYSLEDRQKLTLFDIVADEHKQYVKELINKVMENSGEVIPFAFEIKRKDGSLFSSEGNVLNMLQDKNVHSIVVNFHDVTKTKAALNDLYESEKLYRNLFSNLLSGFAYCKVIYEGDKVVDYSYLAVNKEYEQLLGSKVAIGKNVSELFPGLLQSEPEYAARIQRVASTRISERFETLVKPLNKWFSVSLYSPNEGYFISLVDNITQRKAAEKMLAENLEELERSNKELEQFAYIASHDLQEPLRMVGSYVQLIEKKYKGKLDADADEFIHFAVDGAKRMKQLISDLLNYSRITKVRCLESVDLNKVMEEVLQNLSVTIAEKGGEIQASKLPLVTADHIQMSQLFQNLLSNALKFTSHQKKPKIEIRVEKLEQQWKFSVSDNGIGIDEKYKEKIFVVFKQLHSKDKYGGTGIGLAIAKKIVEGHGGKIWFESVPEIGTTFYFTLNA